MGTFFESKMNCTEHIVYIRMKCTKLIDNVSKNAKQSLGISYGAMYTVYKGAILPLLLYGMPVWIDSMAKNATKQYTTENSAS